MTDSLAKRAGSWVEISPGVFARRVAVADTVSPRIFIWAGASTTNAPLAADEDIPTGSLGYNNNAITPSNVYTYDSNNDAWRDTGATVRQAHGGA